MFVRASQEAMLLETNGMVQIQLKRVYETKGAADGFRVWVDKLWPRGMKKEYLQYDLWAKGIAPSTELRKWFHQDNDAHWEEFRLRYTEELRTSVAVEEFLALVKEKQIVTLLYASNNAVQNHATVLRDYLESVLHTSSKMNC